MSIEDEIRDRTWSLKVDYLNEKDARHITKLIQKARSAPLKSTARWYLDWAEQLVKKARDREEKIWADSVEESVKRVYEFSFVNQN